MNLNLHIHTAGIISAAGSNADADFLSSIPDYNTTKLSAKEPDYTGVIPPMQLRRMSRAVRMGIGASKQCLETVGIDKPDAISVGTAMGCLQDTENFLSKMAAQEEQLLTPTAFIQSTHNTVAGQIALLSGCTGHNLTYSHRGHSFEHAVIDAQLYLQSHPGQTVLAGGIDELTDTSLKLMQRSGIYTSGSIAANDVLNGNHNGAVAGEGASFVLLRDAGVEGTLQITSLHTFTEKDSDEVVDNITSQLNGNYHLALLGINGDSRSQTVYTALRTGLLKDTPQAAFKHLCGDWATASAFAVGLCSHIANHGIPQAIMLDGQLPRQVKNILIINHFMDYWSCWQLKVS